MIRNLSIGNKLSGGFGGLVLLILIVMGLSYIAGYQAIKTIDTTDQVRLPAALASSHAQVHLHDMVGSVRGYLALGDSLYREEYYRTEQDFEDDLRTLQQLSATFDENDRQRLEALQHSFQQWKPLPNTLFALRDNPMQREPAYQWLNNVGLHHASTVLVTTKDLIRMQAEQPVSSRNNALLQTMADFQVSFSEMVSSLRGYVTTKNANFRFEYTTNVAINEDAWVELSRKKVFLTPEQQALLDTIEAERRQFLDEVPAEVLAVLDSARWREDLYLFRTEAVPLTEEMQDLLGHIADNQQQTLQHDLAHGRHELAESQRQALMGGVLAVVSGVLMAMVLRHIILTPIRQLTRAASSIQAGNLHVSAPVVSNDEIGMFAATFNEMTNQLRLTITERLRAEEALLRAHDELEQRVQERTAELSRANRALEHVMRHLELILEAAGEGIIGLDERGCMTFVNPTALHILGYTAGELIGQPYQMLLHPLRSESLALVCPVSGLPGDQQLDLVHRIDDQVFCRKDGTSVSVSVINTPMFEQDRQVGSVILFQDITERKVFEQQLRHRALHDSLTNLPNRTLFLEFLGHALKNARRNDAHPFVVLFLDLDNFKVINDSLGHLSGDQLLVMVAGRLKACLRTNDIIARFGGDEFVILLEDITDPSVAIELVERIQHEIALPLQLGGHEITPSASTGIVISSSDYTYPEDILRDADTAMYRAKMVGPNQYAVFDTAMHAQMLKRLDTEESLRRAIENDELRLHYQPIVELASGRIVGFEALVRWMHPQRGMLFPNEFLPVAMETGLIGQLDWWIVREACRQMCVWVVQFPHRNPLTINVNLSNQAFMDKAMVERVSAILEQTGLDASRLKLEITEHIMMEHVENTVVTLNRLCDLGIQLCIDDFGTGYSSLLYLHRFPFQTLKIDKSFVFNLNGDAESAAITQSIVLLSHMLQKDVVAEGIETVEHLTYLQGLHCEYGQGYLFAKAVPPDLAMQLLEVGVLFDHAVESSA